ncbi:MAG: DUF4080 domain-containing protein [Ruthenibacterium sp.]
MPYTAALCALNAKYVHASLAPWCLAAGVQTYQAAPAAPLAAHVVEGTIHETQNALLSRILAVQPQAACFACYIWNIGQTLALAARLKAHNPAMTVILGGPEVSYNAAEVLRENPQADYVLSGEGEQSLPALLSCLAAHRAPQQGEIAGLCTREFESAPCVLRGDVPSPYTPEYLKALGGRIAYLETSRGCPYSCAFCLSGRCGTPRYFPLAQSLDNLTMLANAGTRTIKFVDRTFNANPAHANAILRFILANYGALLPEGVCFHFELAGDILREDTMALLAQMPAGAVQLEIGMQSFCEETLAAVHRKTDTAVLCQNIRRLVAMGNMHVHIDLIAGLPHEDLSRFASSFDTGYALGAQMLQLGFLKLLHGAPMREIPSEYPCEYSAQPPYAVTRTPWLSPEDFALLTLCEDALERIYNSGRFLLTAEYALSATKQSPFAFYCALGRAAKAAGLATHHVALDAYTAFLYETLAALPQVDKMLLRDAMVRDRLAVNSTGRLPAALQIQDKNLAKATRALAADPASAPKPGAARGVALLYGARRVCFVDYTQKNPVTGRYFLHERNVDNVFAECYYI